MIQSNDFLAYVPTLERFLKQNPPSKYSEAAKARFEKIRALPEPKQKLLSTLGTISEHALRLELADFAKRMRWIDWEQKMEFVKDATRGMLQPPFAAEEKESICYEADDIRSTRGGREFIRGEDLPDASYENRYILGALGCLKPRDSGVQFRVVRSLNSPDPDVRKAAASALYLIAPQETVVLEGVLPSLRDPSVEVRLAGANVFRNVLRADPEIIDALDAAFQREPDSRVKAALKSALQRWKPQPRRSAR
jgi:HEAT repeats